jgi:hypothetical protein
MAILADEDDWSLPSRSASQVPRPKLGENKPPTSNTVSPAAESRYALRNRLANATKNNPVVAYGTNESKPSSDPLTSNIVSTSENELDVEGALQSLPPAYRDALKKQLALVQKPASGNPSSDRLIAKSDQTESTNSTNARDESSEATLVSETKVADSSKAKSGISVRLTDSIESSIPNISEIASSTDAKTKPDTVSTAIAMTENKSTAMNSDVVPASATTPVSPTPPSAISPASSASTTSVPAPPLNSISGASSSANTPASWLQSVATAIELLEKQLLDTPTTDESLRRSQEITLRMLYVTQRRLEDAARPIDSMSESEQEYIRHQMLALHEASNPDAMPVRSRHWSLVMNSQREATNHLAAASNIEVKSLAFCTEVERYGVITKFPKYQFRADEEVLLYCEIENVAAEKVRNGYETQLQGSYEIIDSQGRKVADQLLPMEPEVCQNHRRDYFIVYKIYMPQQIASGSYQMKLTIEDLKGRKFGQSQIEFQIRK